MGDNQKQTQPFEQKSHLDLPHAIFPTRYLLNYQYDTTYYKI